MIRFFIRSAKNSTITPITTSTADDKKDEEKKYYYKERSFGSFSRSVALGTELDPEDVKAEYKDGILTVTLKKAEARKARKIDIKSE